MKKFIHIRGARENNLKNIDIDIPREQLVVITGVSGSGKSSLAFDTIFAEGQRRYVESLSSYARQFLDLMKKPEVDLIEGLSPAISIEQKTTSNNPRSTVGTITEIYDYLRVLWARIGVPHSPVTNKPIQALSISQMVDKALSYPSGTKLVIMAPVIRTESLKTAADMPDCSDLFSSWIRKGYTRVKIGNRFLELDTVKNFQTKRKQNISLVIDRIIIRKNIQERLAESIEKSLNLADGLVLFEDLDSGKNELLSSKHSCPISGFCVPELEPRLFSFNSVHGACPECGGLGYKPKIDPKLVIPNERITIRQGAIAPWYNKNNDVFRWYDSAFQSMVKNTKVDLDLPWCQIPPQKQQEVLYGINKFEGVIPYLERRFLETESDWIQQEISHYQHIHTCSTCHGQRLNEIALSVKINNKNISDITHLSIEHALKWFTKLPSFLTEVENSIAGRLIHEICGRLKFLYDVGLEYLSLDRCSGTLSGGESQRIRLASQIGSALSGVLYVLDEPSIGLHQRDNDKLLNTLKYLRDLGNTVIVVEHDEDAIRNADYVLDIGPVGGQKGGYVIAQGTPEEIIQNPHSITGQYLSGQRTIPIPLAHRQGTGKFIHLIGATLNNLKNIDIRFPLGTFTCVTGVSGSGKSSLIMETLYKGLDKLMNHVLNDTPPYKSLYGSGQLSKVINIDQTPIGRTPRSNPATYTGIMTSIREWYAGLPESQVRGYKAGRFSFNVKGGRCEKCNGDGVIKVEMHFLPDVYVKCDACQGTRYNRETLEVLYRGKSIADVLDMTVDEAAEFFKNISSVYEKCQFLQRVGLGYISLGQSSVTLSGGEAQRIKLAKELSRQNNGKALYILDEPTTGLHFADIHRLLDILHTLVNNGNTVIVIEHNLDVIKTADYIIDMGPEGGENGGYIIAQGTPEEIMQVPQSYTGKYLKKFFDGKNS